MNKFYDAILSIDGSDLYYGEAKEDVLSRINQLSDDEKKRTYL